MSDNDETPAGGGDRAAPPPSTDGGADAAPSTRVDAAARTVMPTATQIQSFGEVRPLQPGDVLNHIFEVKRLIGRGGMGEVYEGINVNSEERVAIKVMLPHLAAEPTIQAMFRKEARTLTRLSHQALVQYRVLAQEPELGRFYIVTEFVDGKNLSDVLGTLEASEADLRMLLIRLAEGLAAAHQLGAIHRDISPDNVMLQEGRLDRAKIIDFGIAKDLDATQGTIIGTGFAGKLSYVAPEQLGDYNRNIGPWTDVYSLGLVILAVAMHKDVNMGATLVEAVDMRRKGPDLSPIPARLRPVIAKMTAASPTDRVRTMEEVIEMVKGAAPKAAPSGYVAPGQGKKSNTGLLVGGGIAAALVLAGGGYALFGNKGASIDRARSVLVAGLGGVRCSWLDVADAKAEGGAIDLFLRGVAGHPDEAKSSISHLLETDGMKAGNMDFNDVFAIGPNYCTAVDAFRQIRDPNQHHIDVSQREYAMGVLAQGADKEAGKRGAAPVITIDLNNIDGDVSIAGIEQDGTMEVIARSKSDITSAAEQTKPGVYQFTLNTTHSGWSGVVMLYGKGPFDAAELAGGNAQHDQAWADRFLNAARGGGWRSDMVWYRVVES